MPKTTSHSGNEQKARHTLLTNAHQIHTIMFKHNNFKLYK
jgi:hypothetical protein